MGKNTYSHLSYAGVYEEFAQTKIDNHPDKEWDEIEYWVPMKLVNIYFLVQREEVLFIPRRGFSWGWAKPSKEIWEKYIEPLVAKKLKNNKKYCKIIKSMV